MLFLVLDFLFVAALYVLLGAQFLAVIQVLVYAGGIVVLYLFVVMLVNLKRPPEAHADPHAGTQARVRAGGGRAGRARRDPGLLSRGAVRLPAAAAALPRQRQHRAGRLAALHDYLIPFEIASMLLLVAMVGAIVLARKDLRSPITPYHYMVLSAALFIIGLIGVMVRRNIIIVFMSIELMLNAVNINLVAFSHQLQNASGRCSRSSSSRSLRPKRRSASASSWRSTGTRRR